MIDLETMGITKRSAIISLGAVMFDIEDEKITHSFYTNIALSSCVKMGLETDKAALDFWAKDDNKAARDEMTKNQFEVQHALRLFVTWCHESSPQGIIPWANGATFDLVILEWALQSCSIKVPWNFRFESDYRTFKRLYPQIRVPRVGTKHNALDDATHQATHLMRILKSLNIKEETTTR